MAYSTRKQQETLLNEICERLLAVIPNFSRPAFAAVEWALNEITDNITNHSQSPYFETKIEFTLSDAG